VSNAYHSNQRRLRSSAHIRELAAEVQLNHRQFIQPLFVDENITAQTPVATLNGINTDTTASLLQQIETDIKKGIHKFLLFPVPAKKTESNFDYSFATHTIQTIKKTFGSNVWIAADVCLCAYTLHGHCGILNEARDAVHNDNSVKELAQYALQLAQAGADCIAPSDMMDGRIGAIRNILNENGFDAVSIMSYSAKFSSQFYGPFRDACKSAPGGNCAVHNRKTYQASPFNKKDAVQSTLRDIKEGADIVMVKPALPYLDVIHELSTQIQVPLAAYHVSGEYQSIELLAQNGIIERDKAHIEIWTALKRGGAAIIISYAARYAKEWISQIEY
jgi:porphobilinogen synthase